MGMVSRNTTASVFPDYITQPIERVFFFELGQISEAFAKVSIWSAAASVLNYTWTTNQRSGLQEREIAAEASTLAVTVARVEVGK